MEFMVTGCQSIFYRKAIHTVFVFGSIGSLAGFVHVRKSQIQGLFKDIQGHVSANSRTKY
jgi:predicted membrane protein